MLGWRHVCRLFCTCATYLHWIPRASVMNWVDELGLRQPPTFSCPCELLVVLVLMVDMFELFWRLSHVRRLFFARVLCICIGFAEHYVIMLAFVGVSFCSFEFYDATYFLGCPCTFALGSVGGCTDARVSCLSLLRSWLS